MKGILHTLEAVILLAVLLLAAATIFRPMQLGNDSAERVISGYNALCYLDDAGNLRQAAATKDIASIRNDLKNILSDFELELCDPNCLGTTRQGASALDYFVAGYDTYSPVHIRLYLW